MKKNAYKAVALQNINLENLSNQVKGTRIVVGIDVAKEDYYCSLMNENQDVIQTIKWQNPQQSREFVNTICKLPVSSLEVALEPSGTYGDPIRNLFIESGIEVFRVSPKKCHDAAELYDGSPSWHDAKSAAIISMLHLGGRSERWPLKGASERDLTAVINTVDMLQDQYQRNKNRLEAQIARHWPEIGLFLELGGATMLELIGKFGGPGQVAAQPKNAVRFMKTTGGSFLKAEKIQQVVESANSTIGVPMAKVEVEELQYLANRTRELQKQLNKAKQKVEKLSEDIPSVKGMGAVVGKATAAVLVSGGGDPLQYESASEWLKGLGLNLKEKSSGKHKGKLSITKRGSGRARRWLYLAALRLLQHDATVGAWYGKKVARDGGIKMKAIVAIMRKLALGLWHVARGETFDTSKMYNVDGLTDFAPQGA